MATETPWERQPGEGSKAFAAFQMYRDMPVMERSLRHLAVELGRQPSLLGDWSSKWRWQYRVDAWDREQDRLMQLDIVRERKAFARRLAATGALLEAKGLNKVRSYVDRYDRDGNEMTIDQLRPGQSFTDTIPLTEATRMIEAGARLEALGRGFPSPDDDANVNRVRVNPVIDALTAHPERTEQTIELLESLGKLLGIDEEPEISEPDDAP
jgi:hypothetical protein